MDASWKNLGLQLCVVALLLTGGCGGDEAVSEDRPVSAKRVRRIAEVKPQLSSRKRLPKEAKRKLTKKERRDLRKQRKQAHAEMVRKALETPPDDLSETDKRTFRGLKKALSNEDYREVRSFAEQAKGSSSAELRSEAVQALGWFGSKGLSSLTGFLADPDDSVAQEAQNAWEAALMDIEDDGVKLQYLEAAMSSIDDEVMLDAISQNFNQVVDEAAAAESLARVADKGGIGAEKAIEAYEFLSGETWKGSDAALTWAQNRRIEQAASNAAEN